MKREDGVLLKRYESGTELRAHFDDEGCLCIRAWDGPQSSDQTPWVPHWPLPPDAVDELRKALNERAATTVETPAAKVVRCPATMLDGRMCTLDEDHGGHYGYVSHRFEPAPAADALCSPPIDAAAALRELAAVGCNDECCQCCAHTRAIAARGLKWPATPEPNGDRK